ncbi:hypothetical protein CVV38_02190 [Candidatus Peregrinibacteria bacterium HGW-Peregrinibacteria-1]|jgi:LPXTG-site transpeptidase (sortase) family protein|nr:MAG: hypothetical protein CVV38_02190 [Candidatus Peregrinibacteria bacterium HGW-Peregrinibacteria-1]
MQDNNPDKQHFVLHIHDYVEDEEPTLAEEAPEPKVQDPQNSHSEKSVAEELAAIEASLKESPAFILPERLLINENKDADHRQPLSLETTPPPEEKPEKPEKKSRPPKRVYTIIIDALRQLVASAVILGILFFLLNSSAYIELAKHQWEKLTGQIDNSPLVQLIDTPTTPDQNSVTTLIDTRSPTSLINQLPPLNIEVAPIDNRIIIPRINRNIPIIRTSSQALIDRDWVALESNIQEALQDGVVHYPGTSIPGEDGNVVITGHSSYFPWDPGRFKDVFALLHEVSEGDEIIVYWDQKKYTYEITGRKIVLPSEIEVLHPTSSEQLTLITCTPIGTNSKRLIISGTPKSVENLSTVAR